MRSCDGVVWVSRDAAVWVKEGAQLREAPYARVGAQAQHLRDYVRIGSKRWCVDLLVATCWLPPPPSTGHILKRRARALGPTADNLVWTPRGVRRTAVTSIETIEEAIARGVPVQRCPPGYAAPAGLLITVRSKQEGRP